MVVRGNIIRGMVVRGIDVVPGGCLLSKIAEVAQIFGLLFPNVPVVYLFWGKNKLG
jgi:hypothetical protein